MAARVYDINTMRVVEKERSLRGTRSREIANH
jgi:hypothetical protein